MGKTRRKEKTFNDSSEELHEFSSDLYGYPSERKKKKKKSPLSPSLPEYDDKDEDYGYFEKIGKRK